MYMLARCVVKVTTCCVSKAFGGGVMKDKKRNANGRCSEDP